MKEKSGGKPRGSSEDFQSPIYCARHFYISRIAHELTNLQKLDGFVLEDPEDRQYRGIIAESGEASTVLVRRHSGTCFGIVFAVVFLYRVQTWNS